MVARTFRNVYRGSFRNLFFSTGRERKAEIASAAGGFLLACLAFLALGSSLFKFSHSPKLSFTDLTPSYLLRLTAPEHFTEIPEAMYGRVDEDKVLATTVKFYRAFIATITGIKGDDDGSPERMIYPNIRKYYKGVFDSQQKEIESDRSKQSEFAAATAQSTDTAALVVPATMGESLQQSFNRVKRTLEGFQKSLPENKLARIEFNEKFHTIPDYDFSDYKRPRFSAETLRELSKIRVWDELHGEAKLYAEAQSFSQKAKSLQSHAEHTSVPEFLQTHASNQIFIEPSMLASFVIPEDSGNLDGRLQYLRGSEYGATSQSSKERVREPLIGELEPGLLEKAISKNLLSIQLCYNVALRTQTSQKKTLEGVMVWKWMIDTRGEIVDLKLASSDIGDPKMIRCVQEKISRLKMPKPIRGSVLITFPFEFHHSKS